MYIYIYYYYQEYNESDVEFSVRNDLKIFFHLRANNIHTTRLFFYKISHIHSHHYPFVYGVVTTTEPFESCAFLSW